MFRVSGSGFSVWGSGFGVQCSWFRVRVWDLASWIWVWGLAGRGETKGPGYVVWDLRLLDCCGLVGGLGCGVGTSKEADTGGSAREDGCPMTTRGENVGAVRRKAQAAAGGWAVGGRLQAGMHAACFDTFRRLFAAPVHDAG